MKLCMEAGDQVSILKQEVEEKWWSSKKRKGRRLAARTGDAC